MSFAKGLNGNTLTYPVNQGQIDALSDSRLASPMVGVHFPELDQYVPTDLAADAREIEEVRAMVARSEFPLDFMKKYYPAAWGEFPSIMPKPLRNEGLAFDKPQGCANVVHMDNPMDMPDAVLKWVLSEGYKCNDVQSDCLDFIATVPETIKLLTDAVYSNLHQAFQAKYYYGIARPEEVLDYNMTAYPEGCPTHPSFPAGHGAAAASVQVILERFDLDAEAIKVIRDCAYLWAMFRSLAGVHIANDNIAGLKVGGLL